MATLGQLVANSLWFAFDALDHQKTGVVPKSQLKVRLPPLRLPDGRPEDEVRCWWRGKSEREMSEGGPGTHTVTARDL